MSEILKELSNSLTKNDVELRIGSTSAKGFSLLLYKTARTDVKRLNSVCGMNWKNRHFYDAKDLLCCEISVFDLDIKEWVSRVDVGTESYTEKEKGSYSDSFKRAGFRWGIGLELYQGPFIWINWEMEPTGKGHKPIKFYTSSMTLDDYQVNDSKISLKISYKNKGVIFSNIKKVTSKKDKDAENKLKELIKEAKTVAELDKIYLDNKDMNKTLIDCCAKKKEELNNQIPEFTT